MKIPLPAVHAFRALILLVIIVVWIDHGSAEDLQPAVIVTGAVGGPGVSSTGANDYSVTSQDISNLPQGENTNMTDVLSQMPGVAIDQNQQIHIRNTEGPQFQYQINGVLVPLDINTNPPFISMINPMFVDQLTLVDGVLPARYSYATGGVVNIETKYGSEQPSGSVTFYAGQRDTIQPSFQFAGSDGKLSYYINALYSQGNTAFSSATSGPNAIHNWTNQGQAFGIFSYSLDENTKLSLVLSTSASDNQLPNVPDLPPAYSLVGISHYPSRDINSDLNFRDYLAILSLKAQPETDLTYQLAYSLHFIEQDFKPDDTGELIYQGVASTASHKDLDNTLEADVTYQCGSHTLSTGFYLGEYRVNADDSSLVFPVDANGNQSSDVPIRVTANTRATNLVAGIYLNDLWHLTHQLSANIGIRWDELTGFTRGSQFDPTINLTYEPTSDTTLHGGFARYFQVPSFQGISPTVSTTFAGTTAAGPPGIATPLPEDDYEWDIGVVQHLTSALTLSEDNFFEITRHYLDTGQFGIVPIFAPFNYQHGYTWGSEIAAAYKTNNLSIYANVTIGRSMQKGVATGQFNFDPDELAYINHHYIVLDHQPLAGVSAGAAYTWKPYTFSFDAIYSSGLRAGFADTEQLPNVFQLNISAQRSFRVPGIGQLIDRLTIVNLFDRTNLIRPAEGIGIFQSAYGPRFTVFNTISLVF
jgi:outer membrane receptor protein involved in Fe transport